MDRQRRKKQTRLSLAPRDGPAPSDQDRLATNEQSQVASVRYGMANSSSRRHTKVARVSSSTGRSARHSTQQGTLDMAFARAASRASEAAALGLPTPDPSSQLHKRAAISGSEASLSSSDDDMRGSIVSKRKRKSRAIDNATAFFRPSASSLTNPVATPRGKAKQKAAAPKNSLFGSSPAARRTSLVSSQEDSGTGQDSPSGTATRRSARLEKASPASALKHSGSTHVDLNSDDDEPEDASPPRPRRLVRGRKKPASERSDDSEEEIQSPVSKRRTRAQVEDEDGDESDESEVIMSSAKRKRTAPPTVDASSSDASSKQRLEKEDLDEDLEFLRDSSPPPGAGKKLSTREQHRMHLERMIARRASKGTVEISDDDGEEQIEEDDDAGSFVAEDFVHDHPFDHKDNLDDFIEDDDDNVEVNEDAAGEMPLEFTRHAHKNVKEHFKDVVEWMVHNKLNPAFPRDDEIYRIAFRKVHNEVAGFANSKYTSSVWRENFLYAMKARPIFNEEELDPISRPDCVACGRSNHPATFVVTFTGKAYDPDTLENLKEDLDSEGSASDDSSNEGDNDKQSVDLEGHVLPAESHRFFVGITCKKNSSLAHALTHWRWHLYSWIVDWLEHAGYLKAEQVLERENWSTRRRTKYANKVVDELASSEIRNLWRDFKIQLDTAEKSNTNDRQRRRR